MVPQAFAAQNASRSRQVVFLIADLRYIGQMALALKRKSKLKKAFTRVVLLGLLPSLMPLISPVQALSTSAKPNKPDILSIEAQPQAPSGIGDVIVRFTLAAVNSKSPLLSTQVKLGTKTCIAQLKRTSCIFKSVRFGNGYAVSARARNRNGYGAWSEPVLVNLSPGVVWSRSSSGTGGGSVTTTTTTSAGTPGRVATTTPSGGSSQSSTTTTTIAYVPFVPSVDPAADVAAATTIRFDLTDAVGIAQKPTVATSAVRKQSTGSNLLVVLPSGMTRDALIVGSARISQFLIAPNNKLYVLFDGAVNFGDSMCLLAQVYRSTGLAKCLESSLISVDWTGNDSIQFDRDGNIYYSGYKAGATPSASMTRVVRRYANGSSTDYINQYQSFERFVVLPNGDILISGTTMSNGLSWTRRITVGGVVSSLASQAADKFWIYPDGNVYFPVGATCLKRYLTAESILDERPWISWGGDDCKSPRLSGANVFVSGFYQKQTWIMANGKVMMVKNCTPACSDLHMLYPTYAKANQSLKHITFGIPALTSAILVGLNANGINQMVLYDSTSDSSSTLVDGSQEIEFYHVRWSPAQNRVYFDGLRFADNKYVLGYVDLATRQVLSSDILTKLADFQTFSV